MKLWRRKRKARLRENPRLNIKREDEEVGEGNAEGETFGNVKAPREQEDGDNVRVMEKAEAMEEVEQLKKGMTRWPSEWLEGSTPVTCVTRLTPLNLHLVSISS